jgi:RND family efflux transporter MFP subunit
VLDNIRRAWVPVVLLLLASGLAGCENAGKPQQQEPPPPVVEVSTPVKDKVTDYEEFTGWTAAKDAVDVKARVSGYLSKINYTEGAEVNEGDVLYEIDPRPYRAVLDQAEAQVRLQQAQLKYADAVYQRDLSLRGESVSKEDLQKDLAARDTARAQVNANKAAVEQARLNLGFTKVLAPVSGRISWAMVTKGNLVVADQTMLTKLVSQDPMYVYFDVDEHTTLRLRRLVQSRKMQSYREATMPVSMGLADEAPDFPHDGTVNFEDNQLDSGTGTLRLRGVFDNSKRLLSPGLFVRVRLPVGAAHEALLMAEQAIGTDQGQKFVYVIDKDDIVRYRRVSVGRLHKGLRVITEDTLKPGDRVVVSGIQRIRPKAKVVPKLVDMPVMTPGGVVSLPARKDDKVKR